jgi:uncharacterized protein YkwD
MLFAAALAAVVVCVATPPAQAGTRRQMVRAINHARQRQLRFSSRLALGAASWARTLMRRDTLAHSARALRRREGEIIEWHVGGGARINRTVSEWLGSSEHRVVMLNPRYRRAGAGRAVGYMNGLRCTIWVVRFAR